MFCSKCGKEISDDVKFCNFCGQPTGKSDDAQPSGGVVISGTNSSVEESQETSQGVVINSGEASQETSQGVVINSGNSQNSSSDSQSTSQGNTSEAVEKAKEMAGAAGEKAKEMAGVASEKAKAVAKAVAENETLNAAGEKAKEMAGAASEKAKESYNKLDDKKKNIVKIAGAVIVLVLLVLIVKGCFGGGSYDAPFKDIQKLVNKKTTNVDKYVSALTPKFVNKAYKDAVKVLKKSDYKDDIDDAFDEAEDSLKDAYDDLKDQYGKNVKISYKITDKDKLDKDELEEIEESYQDLGSLLSLAKTAVKEMDDLSSKEKAKLKKIISNLSDDLEKVKVTKGYEIDVKIKIKGKEDDDEQELKDIRVIKMNGEWIIDFTSIPGMSSLAGLGSLGSLLY